MPSAFRKVSRVRGFTGGITWYLSEDCLLAAKRMMYAVEYRRFYLRDLESVVVWSSRSWLLRLTVPGLLFAALGALLWRLNTILGAIPVGMAFIWMLSEVALGPTAKSRIQFTGAIVDLPLVQRTRRARKLLTRIDSAVRAARALERPAAPAVLDQPAETSFETGSASATSIAATETHAS